MALQYRRPGVYLEESLLIGATDTASASSVGAFVGVAGRGPILTPVLITSWSDYVQTFGDFSLITPPSGTLKVLSYLPFSVYSFFQNGGRTAYVVRATPAAGNAQGAASTVIVNGADNAQGLLTSFNVTARSNGVWGNSLKYALTTTQVGSGGGTVAKDVFAIQVLLTNSNGQDEVVETWPGLSVTGLVAGTDRVDSRINDASFGSSYIKITSLNPAQGQPVATGSPVSLANGTDPNIPSSSDLAAAVQQLAGVDGPLMINIVGYLSDSAQEGTDNYATVWNSTTVPSTVLPDRQDVFIINDSAPPRLPTQSNSAYKTTITSTLGANTGDSYCASYGPWIAVPNPSRSGASIYIPPGGAVMGVIARTDSNVGPFKNPAGMTASINNAVGTQAKWTPTEEGDLNSQNINVIKPVVGSGVCIMGARTRKTFGADKFIGPRRTLIYIKEIMRRTTQFAVFENNDERLWASLRQAAERILRPLWQAGGLKGENTNQAYFINCDSTTNPPSVIQSGEVRMDIGVALEYPAEFIIVRLTQVESGAITAEVL